ncbi:PLP-dependent aminotransferase family protein [Veillonellaceae bacterium M2-8]|nr:PLP-dependent aminotransferase family protein [Veillonellaceae bacterium M2-8]
MLQIDPLKKSPYYVQIYAYFRQEIEQGRITAGVRLPAIRELAKQIHVSKMTVEKAYKQLAEEGYILQHCKSRYEATYLDRAISKKIVSITPGISTGQKRTYLYDFGSGDMDMEGFPLALWRKYMNRVLSDPVYLSACDDEQGVSALRIALSNYVYETRGVKANPDCIVIGAGTSTLLHILTTLLRSSYSHIAVENPGFRLGRELFRSAGYQLEMIPVKEGALDLSSLEKKAGQLIYVSPSHQFPTGTVMRADLRYRLITWAKTNDGLIIEDDYDSELRYYGRPIPALQGLDDGEHVIYMGALSKILPFFVRLSYMILPSAIVAQYHKQISLFRQTASVAEQCVLAAYITSGEMYRHVKRLRRMYQEKAMRLEGLLRRTFGSQLEVQHVLSGVYCLVRIYSKKTTQELVNAAAAQGCRVLSVQSFYEQPQLWDEREFLLSFTKISSEEMPEAVQALYRAWKEG